LLVGPARIRKYPIILFDPIISFRIRKISQSRRSRTNFEKSKAREMENLTLAELKTLCAQRGVAVSGNKDKLIERLTARSKSSKATTSTSSSANIATKSSTSIPSNCKLNPNEYETLTIPQLKDLCRDRGLPVGGIKDDLVARLSSTDPRNMTLSQLRDHCRDAGLPVTGTKTDLSTRVLKYFISIGKAKSPNNDTYESKSLDELKEMCRENGLTIGGKKEELIVRLRGNHHTVKNDNTMNTATTMITIDQKNDKYDKMTVPKLKDICRERGLVIGGTKEELVARLLLDTTSDANISLGGKRTELIGPLASSNQKGLQFNSSTTTPSEQSYYSMTLNQLKELCRDRTLPVTGKKEELVGRLQHHDDLIKSTFKKRKTSLSGTSTKSTKHLAAIAEPKVKKGKATSSATNQSSGSGRKYVVYTTLGYRPDGFHAYHGPPEPEIDKAFASKEAANKRVEDLFYNENPWGWVKEDFDEMGDEEKSYDANGLLTIYILQQDNQEWTVTAKMSDDSKPVASTTKKNVPTPFVAVKSRPALKKNKSSAKSTKKNTNDSNDVYVVYSSCGYPPDGFHSYCPPTLKLRGSFTTKIAANKKVREIFYKDHPFGCGIDELEESGEITEKTKDGLLKLYACPPDDEEWLVVAKRSNDDASDDEEDAIDDYGDAINHGDDPSSNEDDMDTDTEDEMVF
jgi:hypothetical protein